MLKLTIELIPSSSWQNNLRNILKPEMWNEIRKKVIKDGVCSICKTKTKRLHAHEQWKYDDNNSIQILKDIIPLCFLCHGVKHIGFSGTKGATEVEKYIHHFMKINKCDRIAYQKHLRSEIGKFNERSKYEWQLNLDNINKWEK
jgi:hypothetical protein